MSDLDPQSDTETLGQIITAATNASSEMLATIEGRADTAIVNHDCRSFRLLALMLARLADECRKHEQQRMDAPIDGFRFWVAKPQLDAALARARAAEAEVRRLSQALHSATLDAQLIYGDSVDGQIADLRRMAA